jgi:hypothetical protein
LDIPQSILNDHLIPRDYYKPKIEIRNYYLKWNDESYGIPQKEIPELKRFVTNAIHFVVASEFLSHSNLKKRLAKVDLASGSDTF